jgi:hypothetical protein
MGLAKGEPGGRRYHLLKKSIDKGKVWWISCKKNVRDKKKFYFLVC